jgi:cell division protein FtsZ
MNTTAAAPVAVAQSTQPTLQFEDNSVQAMVQKAEQEKVEDAMMPTLSAEKHVELPSKNTVDKTNNEPVFFEISSSQDQVPVIQFDTEFIAPLPKQAVIKEEVEAPAPVSNIKKEASNTSQLSSGGFLVKPTQIYAEVKTEQQKSTTSNEELLQHQPAMQADEPAMEMKLVVKETLETAEEKEALPELTQPFISTTVEEPAMQDETEELRRRATERIAKLRNLSFNINATDPNNEFETVPAYLRRNMEIHNQIADVESFYSNYTVKSDDNNQAEINTINNFLDGKKPD